jgi:hypothetical protein
VPELLKCARGTGQRLAVGSSAKRASWTIISKSRKFPIASEDVAESKPERDIVKAVLVAPSISRRVASATRRAKHLRFSRNACQALYVKIFFFPKRRINDLTKASRASQEGRIDRHDSLARDAMDTLCRKTCGAMCTVKPCGPDSPTLESSLVDDRRWGDGG